MNTRCRTSARFVVPDDAAGGRPDTSGTDQRQSRAAAGVARAPGQRAFHAPGEFAAVAGFAITKAYGMTEVATATLNPPSGPNKPESIGTPGCGYSICIRDDARKPASGYWNTSSGKARVRWRCWRLVTIRLLSLCRSVGHWPGRAVPGRGARMQGRDPAQSP